MHAAWFIMIIIPLEGVVCVGLLSPRRRAVARWRRLRHAQVQSVRRGQRAWQARGRRGEHGEPERSESQGPRAAAGAARASRHRASALLARATTMRMPRRNVGVFIRRRAGLQDRRSGLRTWLRGTRTGDRPPDGVTAKVALRVGPAGIPEADTLQGWPLAGPQL